MSIQHIHKAGIVRWRTAAAIQPVIFQLGRECDSWNGVCAGQVHLFCCHSDIIAFDDRRRWRIQSLADTEANANVEEICVRKLCKKKKKLFTRIAQASSICTSSTVSQEWSVNWCWARAHSPRRSVNRFCRFYFLPCRINVDGARVTLCLNVCCLFGACHRSANIFYSLFLLHRHVAAFLIVVKVLRQCVVFGLAQFNETISLPPTETMKKMTGITTKCYNLSEDCYFVETCRFPPRKYYFQSHTETGT